MKDNLLGYISAGIAALAGILYIWNSGKSGNVAPVVNNFAPLQSGSTASLDATPVQNLPSFTAQSPSTPNVYAVQPQHDIYAPPYQEYNFGPSHVLSKALQPTPSIAPTATQSVTQNQAQPKSCSGCETKCNQQSLLTATNTALNLMNLRSVVGGDVLLDGSTDIEIPFSVRKRRVTSFIVRG